MKAIIFNSGLGQRMGEMTKNNHKSMVKLYSGETIFERQIRLLSESGIKDFVITTGPYEDQLISVTKKPAYSDCRFTFVNNPIYDKTNYIYSLYLAKEKIDDDFLILHGDLVFNTEVVDYILNAPFPSTCLINKEKALPDKDFKGRIEDGKLTEVSINIFDENCFTFQPFYKLDRATFGAWIERVSEFIEIRGIDKVYAENALNEIAKTLNIVPLSYAEHYVEEIDNMDDYKRVCAEIEEFDAKSQAITSDFNTVADYFKKKRLTKPFVVLDAFLLGTDICERIKSFASPVFFTDFHPNPSYEDVKIARDLLIRESCDSIISIGGGSAIDTAKAVKLFLPLSDKESFLEQEHVYINFPHVAIPTTAGTGSESTKFSVIYYEGQKQSLTNPSLIPELVLLRPEFLATLPQRQKAATMLDALSQATESLWARKSSPSSAKYAREAIRIILQNYARYMACEEESFAPIQRGANLAGKAINLTATTAAHAMSYKITSIFGIPHGAAVAMCMIPVWKAYNERYSEDVNSAATIKGITEAYGTKTIEEAFAIFDKICTDVGLEKKIAITDSELKILTDEVNPERLKNFPLDLSREDVEKMYTEVAK